MPMLTYKNHPWQCCFVNQSAVDPIRSQNEVEIVKVSVSVLKYWVIKSTLILYEGLTDMSDFSSSILSLSLSNTFVKLNKSVIFLFIKQDIMILYPTAR